MENGMMNGDRSHSPGITRSNSRGSMNRDAYGRTSLLRRNQSLNAKQISFYRNGDKFFRGLKLAVSVERYKEWDSLLAELSSKVDLPTGAVRFVFCSETGKMITDINELQYGMSYVCSSSNSFRDVEGGYGKENQPQWSLHNKKALRDELNNWTDGKGGLEPEEQSSGPRDFIKPKLVTVIKNGKPPQKKVTMLLNGKTAASLNQVLDHLSAKGTLGKVDKLYTVSGKMIHTLRDLFDDDMIFVAFSSTEKPPEEGFDVEIQNYKITPYRDLKRPCGLKRSSSLRTPRQHRDSGSHDGGHTPSRPVRRSSSVKSAGKGSRGRSVSPGPPGNRVNGHTPKSNRSKSPSSTGRKTPSGMANLNDELYPANVFERDTASDSAREGKYFKKRRISVHGLYRIGKIIGDGNFAVVRECKHRKTNKEYALKIINKAKVKGKEHMIENEISILRRVRHNNIVELLEEYETQREIFLVMELVKGGDLFEAIVKATKYTEVHACHMVRDLGLALDYLHCNNIVHRDIKPENLLVVDLPNGRKSLKLADFGLAMEVKSPMFLVCGTPTYVAPEILDESGYGLKVDIWATGVISYILLCGFPPFRSPDQDELFDLILSGEFEYLSPFWDEISDAAKDLIDHMLVVDVNQRYSAKQILSHPWIKGNQAKHKDMHVNLRNEINKNFDSKGRFKSAGIAVHTVKQMNKETYSTRSHCCKYVKSSFKPRKRKVDFVKESLRIDLAHSDGDIHDFVAYGGCDSGEHKDVSIKPWNSLQSENESQAPARHQSSPEILSPTEKHRYFYDNVVHSNHARPAEEARQFKMHLDIEESKQEEKSRSALELRQIENSRKAGDDNQAKKLQAEPPENSGTLEVKDTIKKTTENTKSDENLDNAKSSGFSRFGRTRKQVFRQKRGRRPRSCSMQEKSNEPSSGPRRTRKRSYDVPIETKDGKTVSKYSVPEIDRMHLSLEKFIERDIVFSVDGSQGSPDCTSPGLSSFEQLEASLLADLDHEQQDVSNSGVIQDVDNNNADEVFAIINNEDQSNQDTTKDISTEILENTTDINTENENKLTSKVSHIAEKFEKLSLSNFSQSEPDIEV